MYGQDNSSQPKRQIPNPKWRKNGSYHLAKTIHSMSVGSIEGNTGLWINGKYLTNLFAGDSLAK